MSDIVDELRAAARAKELIHEMVRVEGSDPGVALPSNTRDNLEERAVGEILGLRKALTLPRLCGADRELCAMHADLANAPFDPSRQTDFLHVPKAAGTSLTVSIGQTLSRLRDNQERSRFHFDCHHFGYIKDHSTISSDCRRHICYNPFDLASETGFLAGHISLSTLSRGRPQSQYLTVFREPVTRILSHWLFNRSVTDDEIEPWGPEWRKILLQSRGSLSQFLDDPTVAPQSDNLTLRMILRPHDLIPEVGFIAEKDGEQLVLDAIERLSAFAFIDIIENRELTKNLQNWMERPFEVPRLNEKRDVPDPLKLDMLAELNENSFITLQKRSRLDFAVWSYVARRRVRDDPNELQMRTIARYMLSISAHPRRRNSMG